MKLIDLDPRWLNPDVFIFRSPVGHGYWLSCPRVRMTHNEQWDLFEADQLRRGIGDAAVIVGWKEEVVWKYEGNDFNTMTVTPSIDASASGNWHGHITNGEIVGGL